MSADKQLKAYIDRVLRLKEEQDTLGDDIREVYAEAKSEGYDKTIMGKVVAHLRKVAKSGEDAVSEQEMNFDTYLQAYHRASGTAVATHTHEKKSEQFDPLTGEFLDDNVDPKLAHTIVTGLQTETGRAALIAAVDIMIEREEAEERRSDAGLDIVTKHTEIASASQGEAEFPSDQRETDREAAATGVGANEGGDNVESSGLPAGLEGGPVNLEPSGPEAERATSLTTKPPSPLRPHCRNPGETCGGSGSKHCHSCSKAMREQEEFA
ncbi:DUF2312 domain-containing protein [Ensifer adhaerens]|uniref:DUF2312 domain-containing protein n=1 Tax=Ensifer adhaerens TaxID=106592 RepID=UPI003CED16CB